MKIICGRFHIEIAFTFELCAREICEKFVYKHSEIMEYVKKYEYRNWNMIMSIEYEICKLHGQITREFLGLRMQNV